MKLAYSLLRFASKILYKVLGPNATRLAYSPIGKLIFRLLMGTGGNLRIYRSTEGIELKLTANEAMGFGILYLGVINKLETDLIKKILRTGDVVFDIGAFVDGWHTLLAGKLVGDMGHVYSFEPHPIYFERLQENIKLNALKNVTTERLGISDREGLATFYEGSSGSSLIKSLAEDFVGYENAKPFKIQTTTLDSYIARKRVTNIALIKIDAEGAEMKVLRGAVSVLKSKRAPSLIVEVWDKLLRQGGSSEMELVQFLGKIGYRPYVFTKNGLREYTQKDQTYRPNNEWYYVNIYFVKAS